jgi:cell division protein FtsW (lipid II flippase)
MHNQSRGWESAFLFWLLVAVALTLIIFGHHDVRQVLKMRLVGCCLLFVLLVLRSVFAFGKLQPINRSESKEDDDSDLAG